MKFSVASSLLVSSAFFGAVRAHTRAGAGVYIRQPPTNDPVKDLTSDEVFCNVNGATAVPSTVSVPAGATVTSEWFHDTRGDDIIAASHLGPIVAYLAPADAAPGDAVWTKIYEDGYDGSEWAVTKLIANAGKVDFEIPSSLAAGDYLMRVEILALHESDALYSENPLRGIQLYPSCSQLTVTGSGTTSLPSTGAAFPGQYTDDEPGIHFNVYDEDPNTYVIPGPAVWDVASGGGSATSSTVAAPSSTATEPASTTVEETSVVTTPSSTASAEPTTSVVASAPPETTSTAVAVTSTTAPAATSPAAAVSKTSAASGSTSTAQVDANVCMNDYNKCVAASQPNPDWTGCTSTKESCLTSATYNINMISRAKRSGKYGRLLA
ncbi:glycosyl hydrolase family 61-domain-containing protein [Mucidula mucida]|nr:glycosyl hydrolase family 61-domain-containing protein [Mucidula mucida]